MRWLIGGAVALFVFTTLATLADLGSRQPAAQARPATPTTEPSPYRRITTHGIDTAARLMVNEGAYLIVQRALDERDGKTLRWAWDTYDHFDVPPGTRVEVVKADGRAYHLEVLDGKHAGRRGWVSAFYVDP